MDVVVTCGLTSFSDSPGAGKDLMWYARDGKQTADEAAMSAREEIERIKQEEDEAMRVIHSKSHFSWSSLILIR